MSLFTLLEPLVPSRGTSRQIFLHGLGLIAGSKLPARQERDFYALLLQSLEVAEKVLHDVVIPEESEGRQVHSDRDDPPRPETAVSDSGYHAAYFWIGATRIAHRLGRNVDEICRADEGFQEVVGWMYQGKKLTGELRLNILSMLRGQLHQRFTAAYGEVDFLVAP